MDFETNPPIIQNHAFVLQQCRAGGSGQLPMRLVLLESQSAFTIHRVTPPEENPKFNFYREAKRVAERALGSPWRIAESTECEIQPLR